MMDTSMTGILNENMLDDNMLEDYDNNQMALDVSPIDGGNIAKRFTTLNSTNSQDDNDQLEDQAMVPASGDSQMTGAGAGPLPTGFGAQTTLSGGSTLTEFTKRRNWAQKVVEELKDFLHILTPDGRIIYVSPSGESLTGYNRGDLVGKFIVDFIHPDDSGIFVREFNESIASGHPLRFFYRFKKKDGTYKIFESHGHPHLTSEAQHLQPPNTSMYCKGFFMMARPYPTKKSQLLDSLLEHKIENERLTRRIAELKREEAERTEELQKPLKKTDGRTDMQSDETDNTLESPTTSMHSLGNPGAMLPPTARPLSSGLPWQNLESGTPGTALDSVPDKMATLNNAAHIESIEMLTGLRYREGERSQGISTGDQSPALIRGDAGIAIPLDKESRSGDKKKKIKLPDEYVCTDCGKYLPSLPTISTINDLKVHSTLPNGEKDPVDRKHFAMPAVFDGQRKKRRRQDPTSHLGQLVSAVTSTYLTTIFLSAYMEGSDFGMLARSRFGVSPLLYGIYIRPVFKKGKQ